MLTLVFALAAAVAPVPRLVVPVRCALGAQCFVQKLPDHAAGPAVADFRCGALSTDAHDGTDFRVADTALFASGVPIVAAAAGRVLRVRDGEPDISVRERGGTGGRDAGNGVVIDHGGGWTTQYSHARNGSIAVRPGDVVVAGQRIATVGLSGNTEYPHLHFTVRLDDEAVDPFTGRGTQVNCGAAADAPMWASPIAYTPTALVAIGFAAGVDDPEHPARSGLILPLRPDRPLLLWADLIGARAGDEQRFTILAPDGTDLLSTAKVLTRGGLVWFAFAGKRAPAAGWAAGRYVGRYVLSRDGRPLLDRRVAVELGGQRAAP